jgi:curved DNA-binding protein CbpA
MSAQLPQDPYEVLGVPRDATWEEIRKAYRRASSAGHPDRAGGNAARQIELNVAWALLSDADRKAHYDATGEWEKVDTQAMARDAIARELAKVLYMEEVENPLPVMRASIESFQAKVVIDMATRRKALARVERTIKRLKCKKDNFLRPFLNHQLRIAERDIGKAEEMIETLSIALELLESFSFDPAGPLRLSAGLWLPAGAQHER